MASSLEGAAGGAVARAPARLLLGSIHCHSTFSDGTRSPEAMLRVAGDVGLDFLAITDHVPPVITGHSEGGLAGAGVGPATGPGSAARHFAGVAARFPAAAYGVVRVPGLEYSPRTNHYLVLGADPWEVPAPDAIPGWPRAAAYLEAAAGRPGALGFLAHPDDEGSAFLKVESFPWDDWSVDGFAGMEVWNLSTDLARSMGSFRDVLRTALAGPYRAVPPPSPATLARWDRLGQRRRVVGIAGTDAHALPVRWHGLPLTVIPYDRAFASLETGVWVDRTALDGPVEARVRGILDALGRGRALMVNRAWGHPLGFVFQARRLDSDGLPFVSGEVVPAGCPVRFEVATPGTAWIRLLRNGEPVANTYGRELSLEPFPAAASAEERQAGPAGAARVVQEAWRAEVWVNAGHWARSASGFFLWILSNHIYRALPR